VAKPLPRSQVDGHAKGNKNTPYLQKLSNKRAIAVKTELTRQGVQADHIKYKGSGAVGRGMHVFITVDHIGARGHAPACVHGNGEIQTCGHPIALPGHMSPIADHISAALCMQMKVSDRKM